MKTFIQRIGISVYKVVACPQIVEDIRLEVPHALDSAEEVLVGLTRWTGKFSLFTNPVNPVTLRSMLCQHVSLRMALCYRCLRDIQ